MRVCLLLAVSARACEVDDLDTGCALLAPPQRHSCDGQKTSNDIWAGRPIIEASAGLCPAPADQENHPHKPTSIRKSLNQKCLLPIPGSKISARNISLSVGLSDYNFEIQEEMTKHLPGRLLQITNGCSLTWNRFHSWRSCRPRMTRGRALPTS